jgi:hypothetical protein
VNYSHRSPKGNRNMRRILNQTANAAARTKGSIFEIVYRRSVPHLGHKPSHRCNCSSTASPDLADLAPGSTARRTRPSRHQAIKATAHCENDPAAQKPRLSDRTTQSSTQPSTNAVIFDPDLPQARFQESAKCGGVLRVRSIDPCKGGRWRFRQPGLMAGPELTNGYGRNLHESHHKALPAY